MLSDVFDEGNYVPFSLLNVTIGSNKVTEGGAELVKEMTVASEGFLPLKAQPSSFQQELRHVHNIYDALAHQTYAFPSARHIHGLVLEMCDKIVSDRIKYGFPWESDRKKLVEVSH